MKRIYFEFSEKAEAQLKRVVRLGNYETMADAIRIAIATEQGIQEEARRGYTQLILRNPNTGSEVNHQAEAGNRAVKCDRTVR